MDWFALTDGDSVDITVTIGPGFADWISLALAFALIVVTLIYVKHTRNMVTEMRNQRLADVASRRREKSDRAAYRCLEVIQRMSDEMTRRGSTAVEPHALSAAHERLRADGPMLEDLDLRDRVGACAEVLFIGGFSTEQMAKEGLSPGQVAVGVHHLVRTTRSALQAYLAERDPTPDLWSRPDVDGCGDRFPDAASAAAWIRCVGRSSN